MWAARLGRSSIRSERVSYGTSPTTLEMCDVVTYLIEDPDPAGPYGAKEVGQGALLPVMSAVANAVFDAVGVRVDEVPISAEKVLKAQ